MAFLCVYVNQGVLSSDISGLNSYVAVRVGNQCVCTQAVRGREASWDREFVLETGPLSQYVSIELWQKRLFGQNMLGQIRVSLLEIGHRSKHSEGTWYRLWKQLPTGQRQSTKHQLQLDIHFELPPGLTSAEAEQLEEKLSLFNQILEDEMLVLREQAERIQRGEGRLPLSQPPDPQRRVTPVSVYSGDSFNQDGSLVCSSTQSTNHSAKQKQYDYNTSGDSFNRDGSLLSPPPRNSHSTNEAHTQADRRRTRSPSLNRVPAQLPKMSSMVRVEPSLNGTRRDDASDETSECAESVDDIVNSLVAAGELSHGGMDSREGGLAAAAVNGGKEKGRLLVTDDGKEAADVVAPSRALNLWRKAADKANEVVHGDKIIEVVESLPHLQFFMRKDSESSTKLKLADVVLKASRQSKKFFKGIESTPDMTMRKEGRILSHVKSLRDMVIRQSSLLSVRKGLTLGSDLLKNEELKHLVYRKTLQALIYPISEAQPHNFVVFTATTPAYCFECEGLLWGLARQGHRCLGRAAKGKKHKDEDKLQRARQAMIERMKAREYNNKEVFELVRSMFNMPAKIHKSQMKQASDAILDGSSKWSAKMTITVVEAQGLAAKDKDTATSDPYVTIKVGGLRKRTKTISRELNPVWNEMFEFESRDSYDRVKVRVWDEDHDLASKIAGKLKREPDDFLGQVLIDVKSLSGEIDAWYNLEGRTGKSAVSGAIRLRIVAIVEGEETQAPYFHQYKCLHESLFQYEYQQYREVYIPEESQETDTWKVFFRETAQEISNEFATRFGVEDIFRAMTHFSCLVNVYNDSKVMGVMSNILAHVNQYFRDLATMSTDVVFQRMSTSGTRQSVFGLNHRLIALDFGRAEFGNTMDQFSNRLKIDLSNYREAFSSHEPQKLEDLKSCVNLVTSICFFNIKVLQLKGVQRSVDALKVCVQACAKQTYQMLRQEVLEEEQPFDETALEPSTSPDTPSPVVPSQSARERMIKPTKQLERLLQLMVTVLDEDKGSYTPCFSQLANFTMWHVSAIELWQLLEQDLGEMLDGNVLDEGDSGEGITTTDAMNLLFKVKYVFNNYVAGIPDYKDTLPEYPRLFRPVVIKWFVENEKQQVEYVVSALQGDKDTGFKATSQYHRYSPSVVDVFCSLTEMYKILKNLNCPDPELQDLYMAQFAAIISAVLTHYMDILKDFFPVICQQPQKGAVLLNNVVEIRELLKKLYINMGGELLGDRAVAILHSLQNERLAGDLDHFCAVFAKCLDDSLDVSVRTMRDKLLKLKGVGNTATDAETNDVIEAVMQTLSEWLQEVQAICEATALKRLLKELWQLLLNKLEKVIVLPPLPENLDLMKMATLDLTEKQSHVLENSLEVFKNFFHGHQGDGLRMAFFQKSQELGRLHSALDLYRCSSDVLIATFIKNEKSQDRLAHTESVGSLVLQISLFLPGNGENRLTVKLISAANLKWPVKGVFRPKVEVNVLGPYLSAQKRRHSTNSKSGTLSPKFNETFHFHLGGMAEPEDYELHMIVKDYCFARNDRVVGLAVFPIREVIELGSRFLRLPLGRGIFISEMGRAILGVLYGRSQDEVVREFVLIKSMRRENELEV